jgi:Protein of unknown function (DUF499)
MDAYKLRPWTDVVRLHPDVLSGSTAVATYAIDLGALVARDPNVPAVYRSPESFFRATYLTGGLRRLLEEVLGGLEGRDGDRVLQLRSPFGGGKSHTLAALYHAAVDRRALDVLSEAAGLPNPGSIRLAVFDGEKFDAVLGKEADSGIRIRTLWGWLAWGIGRESAYKIVALHDERRVAPGGDVIAELLGDAPTLLLLDEVLKYLERSAGERVGESTLERQTLEFMQSLSVEVARTRHAVLVYSLQQSAREAMDNVRLLETLDHLTSRVDAKREPVTGDEILAVLQRRLLAAPPDAATASAAATVYEQLVTRMRVAHADSEPVRRLAEEDGVQLRKRIVAGYPFHPALIDLMKERWAAIPDFQRTRGALRFLASCLHAVNVEGSAGPVLGPGDIPIQNGDVRYAFFTEVGQREAFQSVLEADLIGPNARARRIDDRLAREDPRLSSVQPAMRLATAILMYSFGGPQSNGAKKSEGSRSGDALPPGVTETELLAACVGPELESITAQSALKGLRDHCLYLHFDGARYVFKTTPNVTKLIEDEAENVRADEVRELIKAEIEQRIKAPRGAIIWPATSDRIPPTEPTFQIAYLPLDFAEDDPPVQERRAFDYLKNCGDRPRKYRNSLGLAIPSRDQLEPLRRAARYLKAVGRVEQKKRQLGVTREQDDQLRERKQTEQSGLESALRGLYAAVWLLKPGEGPDGLIIERIEAGGRPLQSTGIHDRMMELLTTVQIRVFGTLRARRIVELLKLGDPIEPDQAPRVGIRTSDIVDAFFGFPGFPRLLDASVVRKALREGIVEGLFAYSGRGEPPMSGQVSERGPIYQIRRDQVVIGRSLADDEISIDDGFIILPQALPPEKAPEPVPSAESRESTPPRPDVGTSGPPPSPAPGADGPGPVLHPQVVRLTVSVNRTQLYASFNAFGNLVEKAGTAKITLEVVIPDDLDRTWLRNAVLEPLEEAGIKADETP